jgi:hypothetical protein
MIRQLTIWAFLVLLMCSAAQAALAQDFRPWTKGAPTSVEYFVVEMFALAHSSGSLTLSGTCAEDMNGDDVVPNELAYSPPGPFHNLGEAMTALSELDPHMSWFRDSGSLMRVSDDRVPDDVLSIRLKRVHFTGAAWGNDSIQDVLSAPEVRAYFKDKHIQLGSMPLNGRPMSTKDLPRLSGDLRDVTVAEALDHVMRFFDGLWIYSECSAGPVRRVMVSGY